MYIFLIVGNIFILELMFRIFFFIFALDPVTFMYGV